MDGAPQRREGGGYAMPLIVCIDATSVYVACAASYIKIPAFNGTRSHVQYLCELLDIRVLSAPCWVGTSDILADGATQGAVERDGKRERDLLQRAWTRYIRRCRRPQYNH